MNRAISRTRIPHLEKMRASNEEDQQEMQKDLKQYTKENDMVAAHRTTSMLHILESENVCYDAISHLFTEAIQNEVTGKMAIAALITVLTRGIGLLDDLTPRQFSEIRELASLSNEWPILAHANASMMKKNIAALKRLNLGLDVRKEAFFQPNFEEQIVIAALFAIHDVRTSEPRKFVTKSMGALQNLLKKPHIDLSPKVRDNRDKAIRWTIFDLLNSAGFIDRCKKLPALNEKTVKYWNKPVTDFACVLFNGNPAEDDLIRGMFEEKAKKKNTSQISVRKTKRGQELFNVKSLHRNIEYKFAQSLGGALKRVYARNLANEKFFTKIRDHLIPHGWIPMSKDGPDHRLVFKKCDPSCESQGHFKYFELFMRARPIYVATGRKIKQKTVQHVSRRV